jgi:hypothetical protein
MGGLSRFYRKDKGEIYTLCVISAVWMALAQFLIIEEREGKRIFRRGTIPRIRPPDSSSRGRYQTRIDTSRIETNKDASSWHLCSFVRFFIDRNSFYNSVRNRINERYLESIFVCNSKGFPVGR